MPEELTNEVKQDEEIIHTSPLENNAQAILGRNRIAINTSVLSDVDLGSRRVTLSVGESLTDAIQKMSGTGGILYLKAGSYTIDENIPLIDSLQIEGENTNTTILNFSGGAGFVASGIDVYTTGTILSITGNGFVVNGSGGNSHSIDLEYSSDQYLSLADGQIAGLDPSTSFTVEGWINFETLPSGIPDDCVLAAKWDQADSGQQGWFVQVNNANKFEVGFRSAGGGLTTGISDSVVVSGTGIWIHLAVVFTPATPLVTMYKNGALIASSMTATAGTSVDDVTSYFSIGAEKNGAGIVRKSDAKIDEVRFWNTTRSAAEILANYNIHVANDATGLVECYRLNNSLAGLVNTGISLTNNNAATFSTDVPFLPGAIATDWLANIASSHQLFIENRWYRILSVDTDIQITLQEPFKDATTYSGVYRAVIPLTHIEIKEVTLIGEASGIAFDFDDVRDVLFEDLSIISFSQGMTINNVTRLNTNRVEAINCQSNGINIVAGSFVNIDQTASIANNLASGGTGGVVLSTLKSSSVFRSAASQNVGDGYNLTDCDDMLFDAVELVGNSGQGLELVSGCDYNTFSTINAKNNGSDGIKITATSDGNRITNSTIRDNTGFGVNIAAATCDNTILVANVFTTTTAAAFSDSGTATLAQNNRGIENKGLSP